MREDLWLEHLMMIFKIFKKLLGWSPFLSWLKRYKSTISREKVCGFRVPFAAVDEEQRALAGATAAEMEVTAAKGLELSRARLQQEVGYAG